MEVRVLDWGGDCEAYYYHFMEPCDFVHLQGKLCVRLLVSCMERVLSCIMMKRRKTACLLGYQSIHFIPHILKILYYLFFGSIVCF